MKRITVAALRLLLALSCALVLPPQAWAQVAAAAGRSGGNVVPGFQVRAPLVPGLSAPAGTSADISVGLTLPAVSAPRLRATDPAQVVLSAQVPVAAGKAAVLAAPAESVRAAAALHVSEAAKAPADAALGEKVSGLEKSVAPLLGAAAKTGASASALHGTGSALQDLLQGASSRRYASDDLVPAAQEIPTGAPERSAGLSRHEEHGASSAATTPVPDRPSADSRKNFRFYTAAVSAVKVGIEALNLALPLLLLDVFHAAAAVSALYLTAEVASLFAGLLGGALVDRLGAGRSMALTGFIQAAAIAGLPIALAAGGAWAMPVVYALFVLNGVAGELFDVARRAALPQIVGKDEGVLKVHNGRLYVWREIAATLAAFATGGLVHSVGELTTLWAHPAFCIVAALAALRLWRLRPGDGSHSPEPAPGPVKSVSIRAWWADFVGGLRIVLGDAQLRTLVLVNIPLNSLHKIFHMLVALIYAKEILGNPAMAAVMLGAWNLGELAGAAYLERRGKESRFSTWLTLAAVASLSVWAYGLVASSVIAVAVSFLLAAAMIGNELGTAASMQSRVPESELGAVAGFVYGFSRAVGMLALLVSGWAFDALGARTAFIVIASIFTAMAPIYLLAAKRFAGERVPGDAAPHDD